MRLELDTILTTNRILYIDSARIFFNLRQFIVVQVLGCRRSLHLQV